MDIYSILCSKTHNKHYLNRYYNFIMTIVNKRQIQEKKGYECHHICPKAKDLFPEYGHRGNNAWNLVYLTQREHFLAHWMLAKCYGGSQIYAFWSMVTKQSRTNALRENYTITSRVYENARKEYYKHHSTMKKGTKNPKQSEFRKNKVSCYDENGNHLLVTKDEFYSNSSLKGINSGKSFNTWSKTDEGRKNISKNMSDRVWMYLPDTGDQIFIKNSLVKDYQIKGYIIGYIKSYNRDEKKRQCPHCNNLFDPTNFKRWHGDNCKKIIHCTSD